MEQGSVLYRETNEGREVPQGFAGFEGNNVLLLLAAMGVSMVLGQGSGNLDLPLWATMLIIAVPIVVVSAYVFGLKQGKPHSYDIELAEWLIIKATGNNYFSPKQVQPMKLPWLETAARPSQPTTPSSSTHGKDR